MENNEKYLVIPDELFDDMERDWKSSLSLPKGKELMQIFPEAMRIVPEKIKEWQEEKEKVSSVAMEKLRIIKESSADEFSKWFYERIVEMFEGQELADITRRINFLKSLLPQENHKNWGRREFESMLERARAYPIINVAENAGMRLRPSGKRFVSLCPFHNEKTPSFMLYSETNTFYCFGCNEFGDVIKLTMQIYGINFVDAVKLINEL